MASSEQNAARRAKRNYAAEYQARLQKAQAAGHPSVYAERVSRVQEFARKVREQLFPLSNRKQTTVSGPLSSFRAQVRALLGRTTPQFYAVRLQLSNGQWIQGKRMGTPEAARRAAMQKARSNYKQFGIRQIELVGFNLLGRAA